MKKKYGQDILVIAILILISIFLWMYLSFSQILRSKKGESKPSPSDITILDPKLDISVFEELKKRKI